MEGSPVRFGITGSGFMARTHAEAIMMLGGAASLRAVWGGTRAPALAARFGVDCEESLESLAGRDDIDAIVVTTPHPLHARDALAALERGKHVLVEKPMATTVEDCDRMIEAALRRKRVIATGYTARFRNNPPRAKALMAEGVIGGIVSMHFSMIRRLDDNFGGNKFAWMNQPESIGMIIDGLPHGVDLMRWLSGAEIVSAAGFCRTFLEGRVVEDTTVGVLGLSNGAVCSVNLTMAAAAPYPREEARLMIVGSRGNIDLDLFGDMHVSTSREGWRLVSSQPRVPFDDPELAFTDMGRMQAFRDQMQSFVDGINGRPMLVGTGIDGRAGVAVPIALMTSSIEGRVVTVAQAHRFAQPGSA